MPIASIRLQPGIDTEETSSYDSAQYSSTSFGRFKAGLFQKLGGWQPFYAFALTGVGKAMHAWQDLNSLQYLAVGTTQRLVVIQNNNAIDISPQTLDSDTAPNFSTVMGDNTVTIVDPNITNVTPDDAVYFRTPISVGGIILSGFYQIATRTGAHSYTIEARAPAASTVNNGGAVPSFTTVSGNSTVTVNLNSHGQSEGNSVVFPVATTVDGLVVQGRYTVTSISGPNAFVISSNLAASSNETQSMNSGNAGFTYYISLGPSGAGTGYGLGFYGTGPYGIGGASGGAQLGNRLGASDWSLDNWGELLIACAENGAIYYWGPASGFQNASPIVTGPIFNTGAFVSMAQQQIIAYGSSINAYETGGIGVYQDPLIIAWCSVSDFFDWTANSEDQAGNIRIPTGSAIIGGLAVQNRNLIWTDLDLWGLAYIGGELVYSLNKVGANCGLIGKHAVAQLGNAVYWMSRSNFFVYAGGGAQAIPCSAYDAVFQDLDLANAYKCVAGSNTDFTEIWFFYPSISGGLRYPDKYVKLNVIEQTWDAGSLDRFAWIDRSILGAPMGIGNDRIVFQHETGNDASNLPLVPSFTTGYFYLNESQSLTFVDQIEPDFKWGTQSGSQNAQIQVSINAVNTPGETPTVHGPYTVTRQSSFVSCRIRARQLSITISSQDTGSFWRLGLVRFRYAQDGMR